MQWNEVSQAPEGTQLAIRGFLVQAPDGSWILAREPDLKSCCIGADHKKGSQITLQGDFSTYSKQFPIEVKGTLQVAEGNYILTEATAAQLGGFPIWTAAVVILCLAGLALKKRCLPLP